MAYFRDKSMSYPSYIRTLSVRDIRFPTSLTAIGSDVMHRDPDYSCAYVVLYTDVDIEGHGLTFTLGRGTEVVVAAVKAISPFIVGRQVSSIFHDFSAFWREVTNDSQLRWLGPDKGVMHMAASAVINALWDLWAKMHRKPLWQHLAEMDPETLVSTIDFRYLTDVLTPREAVDLLKKRREGMENRVSSLIKNGYPAYNTDIGWYKQSDQEVYDLCQLSILNGFNAFKLKVGNNIEEDRRRCRLVRSLIGPDRTLMLDANQSWEREEAVDWMRNLAEFHPLWIEEPTSPDDILSHAYISKELQPLGIAVATGEACCNRVMFKQFLSTGFLQYCQLDATRVGGINEALAVYLVAAKFGVPVIPHTGGIGLCELGQHLQMFDYLCLSRTMEDRWIESVNHLNLHFKNPAVIKDGKYQVPQVPGTSVEMTAETLIRHEYPFGEVWMELFESGKYPKPSHTIPPWVAIHHDE